MLALTGDVEFNRDIRTRAHQFGMHLNEYGLWRWRDNGHSSDSGDPIGGYWELDKAEAEEEILEALGMEWVEPERRNFVSILGRKSLGGAVRAKQTGPKNGPRKRAKK